MKSNDGIKRWNDQTMESTDGINDRWNHQKSEAEAKTLRWKPQMDTTDGYNQDDAKKERQRHC
jgi:hypothetical protein